MTREQLRDEPEDVVPSVEAAQPGTSQAPIVDKLWKLRRQAAQIAGIPAKVPRLVAQAADTLEMLRDGAEAAKYLRTALSGLEMRRSAPRPAA